MNHDHGLRLDLVGLLAGQAAGKQLRQHIFHRWAHFGSVQYIIDRLGNGPHLESYRNSIIFEFHNQRIYPLIYIKNKTGIE